MKTEQEIRLMLDDMKKKIDDSNVLGDKAMLKANLHEYVKQVTLNEKLKHQYEILLEVLK